MWFKILISIFFLSYKIGDFFREKGNIVKENSLFILIFSALKFGYLPTSSYFHLFQFST
jgi:hypothetical protein